MVFLKCSKISKSKIGKINSLLINFGHGHNPSMKKSWKLNKNFAGGGVIIDPGIHILNLLQLFCSKIKIKYLNKIKNFGKQELKKSLDNNVL